MKASPKQLAWPLVAVLLCLGLAPRIYAQSCAVPLAGFGPVDPLNGFPKYYQDSTGLPLALCLSAVCQPLFALPDPTQPLSFPGNFPDEIFYFRAIAKMTTPTGGTAVGFVLPGGKKG